MPTRRVLTPTEPGRASSESAGDSLTSGVAGRSNTRGRGSVISMPRPSPTADASRWSTLARPAIMRARTAGFCTRVSSKRNALMMWACSVGDWLFQKSVACV
jgi:hypothetical protein